MIPATTKRSLFDDPLETWMIGNEEDRMRAARSDASRERHLLVLIQDPSSHVRRCVAKSKNASTKVLDLALADDDPIVRSIALKNWRIPKRLESWVISGWRISAATKAARRFGTMHRDVVGSDSFEALVALAELKLTPEQAFWEYRSRPDWW